MRFKAVELNQEEKFKLKVMDAYQKIDKKNVRYLCRLFGIGKSTFYRWRREYDPYNLSSLKYKSRKPRNPKSIPWSVVVEICEWKRENPKKSHYYLYHLWLKEGRTPPCSPKTIYNWWKKRNFIQVRHKRARRKTKLFNKACLPGELIQVDVKYIEGGRRYQYTAIEVVSKWRYARVYRRFNQENSIDFLEGFLKKALVKGIRVQRIQTDNGAEFQREVVEFLKARGILHQYIWIHTPDKNGVVERSHRTDEEEFCQIVETKDMSLKELNQALEEWITYYNTKRLHFALNFDTPEEYLKKSKVSQI